MPSISGDASVEALPPDRGARVRILLDETPDKAWANSFGVALGEALPAGDLGGVLGGLGLVQGDQVVLLKVAQSEDFPRRVARLVRRAVDVANGQPGAQSALDDEAAAQSNYAQHDRQLASTPVTVGPGEPVKEVADAFNAGLKEP
jgi:hypothetical protein